MKKLKTEEVIRQVANDLFGKFGFEKTSLDDIAKRAHKAKRSIYNHFNSKEELFCTSGQQEIADIRARLQAVMAGETSPVLPRLREYLLLRVQLLAHAQTLRVALRDNLLTENSFRFSTLKEAYNDFANWEHETFSKIWLLKPTSDTPATVQQQATAFADMLQVTLNGLTHTFFVEEKYEQYQSAYEMLINLIVNSVYQSFDHNIL